MSRLEGPSTPKITESKARSMARELLNAIEREGGTDQDYYETAVELASLVYARLEITKHNVIELIRFERERENMIEKYQEVLTSMINNKL